MQSNKHAHRDLCPKNILISAKGDRLIISNFGLVKRVHVTGSYSVSRTNGQDKWMAPERIRRLSDNSYRVTIASDVWSMGCLFYYFLTKGTHPFGPMDWNLQSNIVNGRYELGLSGDHFASKIIEQMIQIESQRRPEMKQVVATLECSFHPDPAKGDNDLHRAAWAGQVNCVEMLLRNGADCNAQNLKDWTPLNCASFYGHAATVKALLKAGACVQTSNCYGGTPLSGAAYNGHDQVVGILIDAKAVVNTVDSTGRTPLSTASFNGHENVVEMLLEAGAHVDAADNDGRTALSSASFKGHEGVVKILLEAGADLRIANKYGGTALSGAMRNGHVNVVSMLCKAEAKT